METLMMVVTVVALALAVGMSVLAWRLLRDSRQRSTARVEALQTMAAETEPPTRFAQLDDQDDGDRPDACPSARAQGRLSEVEAWDLGLGQDHLFETDVAPARVSHKRHAGARAARRQPQAPSQTALPDSMFGATVAVRTGAPPRRWLALAIVGVVMAAGVSTVYALYRPALAAESSGPTTEPAAPRAGGPRPLELLSLRHGPDATGAFTVTGLVQNPLTGQPVKKVIAVVYLFDREGNYFASGKAALDFTVLQPGDESPFVVHVPNVSRVSRYRVGFRSEEGGIVAHVDRRGQLPGGMTGDAIDVQRSASAKRPEGRP